MSGRSRGELEQIRSANRQRLGLAGVGACSSSGKPCCSACGRGEACSGTAVQAWEPPVVRATPVQGLAGVPGGLGFDVMGFAPKVGLETAWPPTSVEYDPSQPSAPSSGGLVADWVMRHLIRPTITVGGIRVQPYAQEADYSGIANAASVGIGAVGFGLAGWILWRAFGPGRLA